MARKSAADIQETIQTFNPDRKLSLRQIAAKLNEQGITTARGGEWSAVQVQRVLQSR